jgi:site-specific DNA-methyltransferase (adenine-specific)
MIYNQDCLEAMKEMSDNQFDLAIVDPPYGIDIAKTGKVGADKKAKVRDYGAKEWDSKPPDKDFFIQLKRISKNQIIFGANHFIENIPKANSSCWVVWDKLNTGNFADSELAYTSFKTAVRNYKCKWNGMFQYDMKNKETRIHPTQKPIRLYEWLLMNYAKEGYKILDTHLGSGSIAIACHNLGFELTGYEIDKDYYEAAKKRIEQHKQQIRMF